MRRALLIVLATATACGHRREYASEAREVFSREFTCPKDRVTVTARRDLDSYALEFGPPQQPPAEVAADPGRLAEWQRRERGKRSGYDRFYPFEVSGCDHRGIYVCTDATDGMTGSPTIACSAATYPP
jgi:hypothetical protein